jgi:steroid 5-alpha reductase family enzyme
MQAVEAVVVTLPVVWVLASPSTPMRPIDWVAVLVWICGFIYECIADTQLTRFLQNRRNKGSVLTRGLWKFSRHPNYAGELVQWWALWLLALAVPGGWMSVAGPLLLTLGIARSIMLVESAARRRPEYARYTQRVPVLIPQLFR